MDDHRHRRTTDNSKCRPPTMLWPTDETQCLQGVAGPWVCQSLQSRLTLLLHGNSSMQLNIVKKSFALLQKKNSMQKIIIQESSRLKHYVRKLPLTVTCKVSKTWPCLQERLMQCCNLPLISALSFHFCGCKPKKQ